MPINKAALIILDGWGHGVIPEADAIRQASTPFTDSLYNRFPHAELETHGLQVGLPEGQMGNSEVGHLNIGAGRIVYQELVRINKAIENKEIDSNPVLLSAIRYAEEKSKPVHLLGLVSDGGVHSHINHLKGLVRILHREGLQNIFLHAFTDGRDTDPKSGLKYIRELMPFLNEHGTKLASVIGRYYSMDRDKRWERIKIAFDALVHGKGEICTDILKTLQKRYERDETDEFLKPIILVDEATRIPLASIESDDVVIFFNFRRDRPRQLTQVLTQSEIPELGLFPMNLYYLTLTRYDDTFTNIRVLFETEKLVNTFGEIVSNHGLTQLRIAETEKYPHVTFFFSGGREEPFPLENRILIPSPKVPTYDLQPEMSAFEVTNAIIKEVEASKPDFICLNYANADMVGHTGVFSAAMKAVEAVDQCVSRLINVLLSNQYEVLIIADHGNSDYMINEDGSPNTAHTMNPVPIIYLPRELKSSVIRSGKLADVAPTLLKLMGILAPEEMTGNVLILEK